MRRLEYTLAFQTVHNLFFAYFSSDGAGDRWASVVAVLRVILVGAASSASNIGLAEPVSKDAATKHHRFEGCCRSV